MKDSTVAWLIQKYIDEMSSPGMKPIGMSHLYSMRFLQRSELGKKMAAKIGPHDIVQHCRERRKTVCAATVNQDYTYLRGPFGYAKMGMGLEGISLAPLLEAKVLLVKYQLIGKSTPRDRRPTDEEIEALLGYFDAHSSKRTKIPMRAIVEFSLFSARRISETCRLRWGDVNSADMTCIVRDMKDPRKKIGNHHEFPLLGRAWDVVMAQPRKQPDNPDERIFPYNAKSAGAAYTKAKKALGIKNLRLHDNRREAASRAFEGKLNGRKYSVPEVMVITGHKNPQMLMRVYTRLHASDLHPIADAPVDPSRKVPARDGEGAAASYAHHVGNSNAS